MLTTTKKMIEKLPWWSHDEIYKKVNDEYMAWYKIAEKKRPLLRQYVSEYNINGDELRAWQPIKSKTLYTNRNLFVSAIYKNKPVITFEWRKLWDAEYADTWNNLLKFDYEELDEDKLMYEKVCNVVDFWIYLAVDEGWDKTTETPRKNLYSPLCWIPDPNFSTTKWFSFHWFELMLREDELSEIYHNTEYMLTDEELDSIKEKTWNNFLSSLRNWSNWEWLWFEWVTYQSNLKTYSVYRHYTKFNNRWYLTEWANDRTLLIRFEEIKAVRDEEKKDPTLIPCPVVHSWFLPKVNDPYWLCVWDLARDNQFSEQQVMNLLFNKINEEVFSGITVFDPDYIDWKELAHVKVWSRKYIPSKWFSSDREVVKHISTQSASNTDWYNLQNMIQSKNQKEIWFDEQSMWVYARTITATQSQLLQSNQNIRLTTIFKVFLWGERNYWDTLWYRKYQENFKMSSQKNIVLNDWIWCVTYTVLWKDLHTVKDLHLRLITIMDKNEIDENNKAAIMASYQPLMQMASDFWKIQLTKQFAKIVWLNKELVNSAFTMPHEYQQALLYLELLNHNEDVPEITDMNENHEIYIQVYSQALDTDAKRKAIDARRQALILSWQQAQLQQWMMWENSATQNQLVSNYISQENKANDKPTSLWISNEQNANIE